MVARRVLAGDFLPTKPDFRRESYFRNQHIPRSDDIASHLPDPSQWLLAFLNGCFRVIGIPRIADALVLLRPGLKGIRDTRGVFNPRTDVLCPLLTTSVVWGS